MKITSKIFAGIILSVLLLPLVFAQYDDSDGDGVVNPYDACPATNNQEGLPIITQNKEYLGCSCSQILEKTGEYCYDVFCATGRPFMIRTRETSSRQMDCGADYCINNTLYDFPDNKVLACADGIEEKYSCNATLTENAQLCINGSVPQFIVEKQNSTEQILILDDYEKLQNRAYLASQNNEIKTGLGISAKESFILQSKQTMENIDITKNLAAESKVIYGTEKTISIEKLTISPKKHRTLTEVYVFEELPRSANVHSDEVITENEVAYEDNETPVLLVWKIDKVSKPVELTYQINRQLSGESTTLVVAREIKTDFWKMMILPVLLIIAAVFVFVKTYEKSVPKRKKIFKD